MGRLANDIAYMAGPIEALQDRGTQWRKKVAETLMNRYNVGIIDPCDKPSDYCHEDPETIARVTKLRESGQFDEYVEWAKPMVGIDYRSVHKADFLVLYIDKDIHMCGSYVEMAIATQERKPVLIVCKQGKKKISGFPFGMIPHTMMFDNFTDMYQYLDKVDSGQDVNDHRRWHFWDYEKIYGRKI